MIIIFLLKLDLIIQIIKMIFITNLGYLFVVIHNYLIEVVHIQIIMDTWVVIIYCHRPTPWTIMLIALTGAGFIQE